MTEKHAHRVIAHDPATGQADPVPRMGAKRAAVTIYDVATLPGFKASTVSRALGCPGRMSAETEERVRRAADELGYRPNPMARALQSGRSGAIGLALSDICDPAHFCIIRGAQRAASAAEYTLLITKLQASVSREQDAVAKFCRSVDGMVLVGTHLLAEELADLGHRTPMVLIDRTVATRQTVTADLVPGVAEAFRHLADLGHSTIGFMTGPADSGVNAVRLETILACAAALGVHVEVITTDSSTRRGGYLGTGTVIERELSAVITANDLLAIGLIDGCREAGVALSEQLSVIGFDDIFGCEFTSPPLSSIRSPFLLMGEAAVFRLIAE